MARFGRHSIRGAVTLVAVLALSGAVAFAQGGNVLNVRVLEGNLSGDRVDNAGDARGGIEVMVNSLNLGGETVDQGTSDDNGMIAFSGLADGMYQVVASETRDCTPMAGPLVELGPGRSETEAIIVVECDFSFLFALLPVALVDPAVDSP